MLKASELIHHLLITRDAGEQVGKVQDLVIDQKGSQVLGVLVDEKGWFSGAHVVRWPAVLSVGAGHSRHRFQDQRGEGIRGPGDERRVRSGQRARRSPRVRTTDGQDLGKFEAFYFDEKSGRILGYELSGGTGRKRRSRSFLPTPGSFEAGKDVAFVSPEAADTLQDLEEALKQSW